MQILKEKLELITAKGFSKKYYLDYKDVLSYLKLSRIKPMYKEINITLYEEQEIYNHIKTMDPDLE